MALMGVSYGTHVALEYARAFPANVDRLILDSIVGPGDPSGLLLDTYRAFPRVLREQCSHSLCTPPRPTRSPTSRRWSNRLKLGPLRGMALDASGEPAQRRVRDAEELAFLLIAGDLNPLLQPFLPAALSSAARGDTAMLMRLRRVAEGAATRVSDLSAGLNVTTACEDAALPYSLQTPIADRPALAAAALAAIPQSDYAPFDAATVQSSSDVDDCLQWPQDSTLAPFEGPLPDVPALLLSGRLDTRTPVENARATAAQLPHATLVTAHGTGHDVLDSDVTGCAATALRRFVDGVPAGRPCAGKSSQVAPLPLPPRSLQDFRSAPQVGGRRGRAVFAILETVDEARLVAVQYAFAGIEPRGGGLRAGHFALAGRGDAVRLHGYAFVPGVRVTGTLDITGLFPSGTVRLQGPRGTSGKLVLDARGGARGRLGGRRVRYRGTRGLASAAAAGARSLRVDGPSTPLLLPRLVARHSAERRRSSRAPEGFCLVQAKRAQATGGGTMQLTLGRVGRRLATSALVLVLGTAANASAASTKPAVKTGAAADVAIQSATLTGSVDPNGAKTTYFFQIGATSLYGGQTGPALGRLGVQSRAVTAQVTGLAPATTYHYRIVASNRRGLVKGSDRTFKTKAQPLGVSLAATPNPVLFAGSVTLAGQLTGTGNAGRQVVLQSNPFPYTQGFVNAANPQVTDPRATSRSRCSASRSIRSIAC